MCIFVVSGGLAVLHSEVCNTHGMVLPPVCSLNRFTCSVLFKSSLELFILGKVYHLVMDS